MVEQPNGTVSVETLWDKNGKHFLAAVHVDRNGEAEIVGMDYASIDEAKSAAWALAQRLGAATVSTKRRARS
jgi:hypothetical protein